MEEDQAVETTHTVMYMEAFGVKEADAIEIQARAGEWKAMTEREPTVMSKGGCCSQKLHSNIHTYI